MDASNVGRLILVVDDEPELRESMRTMLESCGYAVREASTTREALSAIGAERPDVVLTDIFLGDGDGFALLNALRGRDERIPVIAMSGGGSAAGGDDVLTLATKLGAHAIIEKPFRLKSLLDLIETAVAEPERG